MNEVPQHIAIIMDGNRRWAREHGLHELMGHKRVTDDILEPLIEHAASLGVKQLTFWAWSTENWQRKEEEVKGILALFRQVIKNKWKRLAENGVRIQVIGDLSKFPGDIQDSLRDVMLETRNNTRITTVFALNYGGRDEMVRAIRGLTKELFDEWEKKRNGSAGSVSDVRKMVCADMVSRHLDTNGCPDPDLIIRTGGEQRLSGFLLWQSEYSELYFPDFYMPDFTPEKLDIAIAEYRMRKRRFGK